MIDLNATAKKMNAANTTQTAQALLIQTYANSVDEQTHVDFSGETHLTTYQDRINGGLDTAKAHADAYLNTIQPNIIKNITNIGNYYALHNAVASTLPAGSTEKEWLDGLAALQIQAGDYQNDAKEVVISLKTLHKELSTDAASFSTTVGDLNTAVSGDQGVLASEDKELTSIQHKINAAIAGTAVSGATIAGGAFMIAVGSIGDFVTAGTSTPVVLGGIGILVTGIGGEVGSAITLKNLNDSKASILRQEATLKAEVKVAQAISSSYQSLTDKVKSAIDAATGMQNAWEYLGGDLGGMIGDLKSGRTNTGALRELFLKAADSEVKTVITDISTLKAQMAGVTTVVAKPGRTVGETLVQLAMAA